MLGILIFSKLNFFSGDVSVSEQGGKQNAKKSLKEYLVEITATLKAPEQPVETRIIAEEDTSESEASEASGISDESDIVVDKLVFKNGQILKIVSITDFDFPLHFVKTSDFDDYTNFENSMVEKGSSQPKATNVKVGNSYIGEFEGGYYRCDVIKARFHLNKNIAFCLSSLTIVLY